MSGISLTVEDIFSNSKQINSLFLDKLIARFQLLIFLTYFCCLSNKQTNARNLTIIAKYTISLNKNSKIVIKNKQKY